MENASFEELLKYLKTSLIGIHTMKNEHFGISIIEYMVLFANNIRRLV